MCPLWLRLKLGPLVVVEWKRWTVMAERKLSGTSNNCSLLPTLLPKLLLLHPLLHLRRSVILSDPSQTIDLREHLRHAAVIHPERSAVTRRWTAPVDRHGLVAVGDAIAFNGGIKGSRCSDCMVGGASGRRRWTVSPRSDQLWPGFIKLRRVWRWRGHVGIADDPVVGPRFERLEEWSTIGKEGSTGCSTRFGIHRLIWHCW